MVLSILSVTLWPPKGVSPPAHSPLTTPQPTVMFLPPGLSHHTLSTVTTAKANSPPGAQTSPALASGTPHSSLTLPPRPLLLGLPGYSSLHLLLGCPILFSGLDDHTVLATSHARSFRREAAQSTDPQTGCHLEPPCLLLSPKPKPCWLLTLPEAPPCSAKASAPCTHSVAL